MLRSSNFFSAFEQVLRRRKSGIPAIFLLLLSFLSFSFSAFSQDTGRIAGVLVDAATGEALIGANILVVDQPLGAASDVDGNFVISDVPAGTYTVLVQYVGYSDTRVTDVEVKGGERTTLNVEVKSELIAGDEVVVEARLIENTEASLLKSRQRADAVSDAVSAEQFSRTGSGDAAEAVKQVVGASVVDGKYVYVRGLGDRYSNTQLNGVELPSSDPDKKAFQLDLLPTNLLDNIVTVKTFTPDRSGNFSGGIVDVGTKNFPEEMIFKVSYGTSMNSQTSFNDQFLTYAGGESDWLASDDGTRALPDELTNGNINASNLPNSRRDVRNDVIGTGDGRSAQSSSLLGKAFGSVMDASRSSAPVNQSFSMSAGNQMAMGENSSIGYLGSLTYGRSFSFYENGTYNIYTRTSADASALNPQYLVNDSKGSEEASIGALGALSFNFSPEQQVSMNLFYSKSGVSTTRFQQGVWPQELDNSRIISNRVLSYTERDILSYQLRGKHYLKPLFGSTLEWNGSIANTTQDEPNRRLVFSFVDTSRTPERYTITGSNFDNPSRYFRTLEDKSNSMGLDWTIPFTQWSSLSARFKLGGAFQNTDRDFAERIFIYDTDNELFNEVGGDVDAFFAASSFDYYIDSTQFGNPVRGNIVSENSRPQNNYTGEQTIAAGYAMFDVPLTAKIRFIGGARYETTELTAASQDSSREPGLIDEEDILPSVNFVYALNQDMNLRAAFTQTLARPNFREIAPYQNKEFVNGYTIQGNPLLKRTQITNYDLRWEWFVGPGEILAISGFYKDLSDPIERTLSQGSTISNRIVTWDNVAQATILGTELEARLNLGRFANVLSNFTVGGNLSFVKSEVDIADREYNIRIGVDSTATARTRELQGQSPYIANIDLLYSKYDWNTNVTLHFNIFGERLASVSSGATPDIFEQPRPTLDFVATQGITEAVSAKFAIKNLLNSDYRETYRVNDEDTDHFRYQRGVSYSFGLSYNL